MKSVFRSIYAVSMIAGLTIGVGIFSLPYITGKVGILTMFLYIMALTALVLFVNLLFVEVSLKTPNYLRLAGYARMHLGEFGKYIAAAFSAIEGLGTILAYIVIGGGFLYGLLSPFLGGSLFIYVFLYFAVGAIYIFLGSKAISKINFAGILVFFAAIFLVFFNGLGSLKLSNLFFLGDSSHLFLPYGAILFALWGATMVPEAEEILQSDRKKIRRAVILGTVIPGAFYFLFCLMILALSGGQTSPEAISGLQGILGGRVIAFMFLAGIMATFTSYVSVGLNLKKVLWYDMKVKESVAWLITCFVPFLLYLLGFNNFIKIIGFVGAFALAMEGILIVLMYRKISIKRPLFIYPLILIFVAGMIYEIIYFLW